MVGTQPYTHTHITKGMLNTTLHTQLNQRTISTHALLVLTHINTLLIIDQVLTLHMVVTPSSLVILARALKTLL